MEFQWRCQQKKINFESENLAEWRSHKIKFSTCDIFISSNLQTSNCDALKFRLFNLYILYVQWPNFRDQLINRDLSVFLEFGLSFPFFLESFEQRLYLKCFISLKFFPT